MEKCLERMSKEELLAVIRDQSFKIANQHQDLREGNAIIRALSLELELIKSGEQNASASSTDV